MAWMNQERKSRIAAALKAIHEIKDWKYSLAVRNHSTIVMNIRQAPLDLLAGYRRDDPDKIVTYAQVNGYHLGNAFDGAVLETMNKIMDAMNLRGQEGGNYDNSDIQSDYFDVGWYVDVNIGQWDDPFVDVIPAKKAPKTLAKSAGYDLAKKKLLAAQSKATKDIWKQYLPVGFKYMTPGKKSAATKRAKQLAGLA